MALLDRLAKVSEFEAFCLLPINLRNLCNLRILFAKIRRRLLWRYSIVWRK